LRKPPPDHVVARRKKAFEDAFNVWKYQGAFREISDEAGLRLVAGQSMSTTQSKIVSEFMRSTKPAMDQVAQMAASPDFVSNLRTPLGSYYDEHHVNALQLSNDYTRAAAYSGNTAAASDALSTT